MLQTSVETISTDSHTILVDHLSPVPITICRILSVFSETVVFFVDQVLWMSQLQLSGIASIRKDWEHVKYLPVQSHFPFRYGFVPGHE